MPYSGFCDALWQLGCAKHQDWCVASLEQQGNYPVQRPLRTGGVWGSREMWRAAAPEHPDSYQRNCHSPKGKVPDISVRRCLKRAPKILLTLWMGPADGFICFPQKHAWTSTAFNKCSSAQQDTAVQQNPFCNPPRLCMKVRFQMDGAILLMEKTHWGSFLCTNGELVYSHTDFHCCSASAQPSFTCNLTATISKWLWPHPLSLCLCNILPWTSTTMRL